MTRSADECEMSRSCQRATFSSPAWALLRTTRARPLICSAVTGLRLWGMSPDQDTQITFLVMSNTIDEVVDGRVREKAERLGDMLNDPDIVTMALPDEIGR